MSPSVTVQVRVAWCFPRVSGDEPITLDIKGATVEFSPRERG